jgi:hypothetical protein
MNTSFFLVNDSYKVTEKLLFSSKVRSKNQLKYLSWDRRILFDPNDMLLR